MLQNSGKKGKMNVKSQITTKATWLKKWTQKTKKCMQDNQNKMVDTT